MWELLEPRPSSAGSTAAAAPPPLPTEKAAAGWRSEGSKWIGARVRVYHQDTPVDGTILRWLPEDDTSEAIWHMHHDDGDEEDLDGAAAAGARATGARGRGAWSGGARGQTGSAGARTPPCLAARTRRAALP